MTTIKSHQKALQSQSDIYHTFLSKYSKVNKVVYAFVEGQTDPSFYLTFINTLLPSGWDTKIESLRGKNNVLDLYKTFDWQRFPRNRIVFFIDKDLSTFLNEPIPSEKNVYITDNYSIENDIVSKETCERVLLDVYLLNAVDTRDLETILTLFNEQLEAFFKLMVPIMSYIILWRSRGEKINLNNLKLQKLFEFKDGKISFKSEFCSKNEIIKFVRNKYQVEGKSKIGIAAIEKKFKRPENYRKYTRGKYVLWFFVYFCENIYNNCLAICPSLNKKPTKHIQLTEDNAIIIIGNRGRIPQSLKEFITNTLVSYAAQKIY